MRPGRMQDHAADIHAPERRILVCDEIIVEGAERGRGTILQACMERIDDALLEAFAARECCVTCAFLPA